MQELDKQKWGCNNILELNKARCGCCSWMGKTPGTDPGWDEPMEQAWEKGSGVWWSQLDMPRPCGKKSSPGLIPHHGQ